MYDLDKSLLCKIGGGFYYVPLIWGSVLGAVGYTVSNKNDFHSEGFIIAAIGGGITGSLDAFGALGRVLQVVNVAFTAEAVNYIQKQEF